MIGILYYMSIDSARSVFLTQEYRFSLKFNSSILYRWFHEENNSTLQHIVSVNSRSKFRQQILFRSMIGSAILRFDFQSTLSVPGDINTASNSKKVALGYYLLSELSTNHQSPTAAVTSNHICAKWFIVIGTIIYIFSAPKWQVPLAETAKRPR